jgi:O-antigen/teichoic acid export membrane protein
MATAPLLLAVWLHHTPADATAVLVALSAAYLPAATTGASYGVAVAAAQPGIVARPATASALANVLLTVALAPLFGIWGILSGTVLALGLGSLAQIFAVHRRFSLSAASYLDAVLPALRWCGGLALPVAVFAYAVPVHGRGLQALALVAVSVLYLGACLMWSVRSGRMPEAVMARFPRRARAALIATPDT